MRAILRAVPEALEAYAELDLHGTTIEATNAAEQSIARAQRILEAVRGLREQYEARLNQPEGVVHIKSRELNEVLGVLAIAEDFAAAKEKEMMLLADAYNHYGEKAADLLQSIARVSARGGTAANEDTYATTP